MAVFASMASEAFSPTAHVESPLSRHQVISETAEAPRFTHRSRILRMAQVRMHRSSGTLAVYLRTGISLGVILTVGCAIAVDGNRSGRPGLAST